MSTIEAKYEATPPTLTDGQTGSMYCNKRKQLAVTMPLSTPKAITKHDTTANEWDYLWANVAGDIKIRNLDNEDCTFTVLAGCWNYMPCNRVYSTLTTATGLFGLKAV